VIGNPVTRGAEASGASELVAAFLEAAEAALASVGDPHTLHEEITRGERADHGGVDAFGGRWE
jgi:hypothetical protein